VCISLGHCDMPIDQWPLSISIMTSGEVNSSTEMVKNSCQDPGRGRVTASTRSPYITAAAAMGEKNETTQYSSLSRDSERLPSILPSHAVMGENEATFSSCIATTILQTAGGGLLLQHQEPQHAQLLVVHSRGCPPVHGHPLARQVWMGTPGIPMSMGPQPPMTLHPSTSNLQWSRLRSDLTPPLLLSSLLTHRLDREGMPVMPSTNTGSFGQLGLLILESTRQLDSLISTVLVFMGDVNTSYTVDYTSTPRSFYGLFASLLPVKDFGLDKSKLPDCFTKVLLVSMGEGEIIGTDVRRLDQPRYFIPERSCHVTPAATQPASHQMHSMCGTLCISLGH